ncbi:MAG: Crp/Fnr family transcriptional regulator, partial [Candidatus Eremiobacteraeota bacterium]|nr:Crp/Fnr family transcriptional regulator [Candidatus Eremiobacteraeota bacterium]
MDLFWSLPSAAVVAANGDEHKIEALFTQGSGRSYDHGGAISDPENHPERTFYCSTGTLKVTKLLASGREILITILQTGSLWSDRAVLNGYWREVYIEAMEQSDVYAVDNVAFEAFLRERPERLTSFMQRISEQVSDALTLLDDFRGRDVASRLARVLVKFSQQYGVQTDAGVRIDLP